MSYHSAECYYEKCSQCLVGGCACKCHTQTFLQKSVYEKAYYENRNRLLANLRRSKPETRGRKPKSVTEFINTVKQRSEIEQQ